jgi:hypothetical protein
MSVPEARVNASSFRKCRAMVSPRMLLTISALADTVHVLSKGTLVFCGKPADVADDLFAHYLGTAAGAGGSIVAG